MYKLNFLDIRPRIIDLNANIKKSFDLHLVSNICLRKKIGINLTSQTQGSPKHVSPNMFLFSQRFLDNLSKQRFISARNSYQL